LVIVYLRPTTMHSSKRSKLDSAADEDDDHSKMGSQSHDSDANDGLSAGETDSEASTDEITTKPKKSKSTLKRKVRATRAPVFGATLQSLLNTDAPSSLPLSLKPSITKKRNDEMLEQKARKVIRVEKKEIQEKGRITDIIGGWGGESERALRKVAQRGVVKLFNAIQQSQASVATAEQEAKAARGSGKPSLPAPHIETKQGKKARDKDNILGRGKESTLGKDDFFDMIRSGGIVSKV